MGIGSLLGFWATGAGGAGRWAGLAEAGGGGGGAGEGNGFGGRGPVQGTPISDALGRTSGSIKPKLGLAISGKGSSSSELGENAFGAFRKVGPGTFSVESNGDCEVSGVGLGSAEAGADVRLGAGSAGVVGTAALDTVDAGAAVADEVEAGGTGGEVVVAATAGRPEETGAVETTG